MKNFSFNDCFQMRTNVTPVHMTVLKVHPAPILMDPSPVFVNLGTLETVQFVQVTASLFIISLLLDGYGIIIHLYYRPGVPSDDSFPTLGLEFVGPVMTRRLRSSAEA